MHVSSFVLRPMMDDMTISDSGGWIPLVTFCMKPFQSSLGFAGILNNSGAGNRQSTSEDVGLV